MNFNQLLSIYDDPENRSLENPNLDRVRHNVYTPEGEKALKLFDKAVGLMKERSTQNKADPMGWDYQAGIHGIWNLDYEQPNELRDVQEFVDFAVDNGFDTRENILNGDTVLNNCTHFANIFNGTKNLIRQRTSSIDGSRANFLAWHRLYLQYFEEIARENLRISGDPESETWALPYWAYMNEEQPFMPELLRDPESMLYTNYRNPGLNAGTSIRELSNPEGVAAGKWSERALDGLGETGYLSMGSRIEMIPHNQFHILSGRNGGLFNEDGLMMPTRSAAFDPIFWIHHSFIDKIWSSYNRSENAFYANEYDFDQNPWNYVFLNPSRDGNLQKDVVSSWGDSSQNVIGKIYNPDYSYDYFGTLSNPIDKDGPNKVLSILQSSAFSPIVSEFNWSDKSEANTVISADGVEENFYQSIIPLTINKQEINYETYSNFAGNDNLFNVVANITYKMPSPPANAKFLVTTKSFAEGGYSGYFHLGEDGQLPTGFFVQDMDMGMMMPMTKISTLDLGYKGYSYLPDDIDSKDQIVLLMVSNSADTSVQSLSLGLTQNLNKTMARDSDFDAAAYFSQYPSLLLNPEATKDPEGYYNANDLPRGVVKPEVNFRAAAIGIAYLAENPDLIERLNSSSPYEAIANYLDNGQAQGLSLGDGSLRSSQNYFRSNANSDAVILDLTLLPADRKTTLEVVTGRDATFNSTIGFYRIVDDIGTVIVDGVSYQPDDPDYARMAKSEGNLFDPLTGLSASLDIAELKNGIELTQDLGKLAPYAVVNDQTFFTFADANTDGINHFRSLATNTLGFEDTFGGGDSDFDDVVAAFNYTLPSLNIG